MAIQLQTEAFRSIAGTSLTGTLQNVGAVTQNPARLVQAFNGCNDEVIVSWDGGTTEGWLLPPNSGFSIDCSINQDNDDQLPKLPAGAQFQSKHNGSAPTSGTLSITVIY